MANFYNPVSANSQRRLFVRLFTLFLALIFLSSTSLYFTPPVQAVSSVQIQRIAGASRYDTAIQIAKAGWNSADTVVLARGDDFPDALAGAVLAKSASVNGPLLLTEPDKLTGNVQDQILALGAKKVFILGGTGAVSAAVENTLKNQNLNVTRLQGNDRYATAAAIALTAVGSSNEAILASGSSFADALSISSYAAAKGIPLLLTEPDSVPQATLDALKKLGVQKVTLVGGTGVIKPSIQTQLEKLSLSVTRLSGNDRYLTNIDVLTKLTQDASTVYVATGEDFPDALAGAALAAKENHPIVLVPLQNPSTSTLDYVNAQKNANAGFVLLGGTGVITTTMENILRTGSVNARISLQYVQGSSYLGQLNQVNILPNKATDYTDIIAPSWYSLNDPAEGSEPDGSLSGIWDGDGTNNYAQLAAAVHGRNLKILPILASSWSNQTTLSSILSNSTARTKLIDQIQERIGSTGADGIVIDFENVKDTDGPNLTLFMKSLYARLHPQNKLVVMAVMSRTSPTAEPWLAEFNYHDLAQNVDYLNIMTYDYCTSTPGPIAPLPWVRRVLDYTQSQGVDMKKVLLGTPYYGRDWTAVPPTKDGDPTTYTRVSVGPVTAAQTASSYGATIQRDTTTGASSKYPSDPVGIPYYTYTDNNKAQHTVYFDDLKSWEAKLNLLDNYGLGGIGAWSLYWVNADTAGNLFPLLKEHLR